MSNPSNSNSTAAHVQPVSEYSVWENDVIEQIEHTGMTRSDIQGLVEGQDFAMAHCWGGGLNPADAAKQVLDASTPAPAPGCA